MLDSKVQQWEGNIFCTIYHKHLVVLKIAAYFVSQSAFMNTKQSSLQALEDIRRIMDRSSRFISLSGLSGISAGLLALLGSYFAYTWIEEFRSGTALAYQQPQLERLEWSLVILASAILISAVGFAIFFTYRKAQHHKLPVWDASLRRLLINLFIPLAAGAGFIAGMLFHNDWEYVAPGCLIFYGLALVNASKYTYRDIRYLGLIEIVLGWVSLFMPGYGLFFWAGGFGLLHIIYGIIMWYKYDMPVKALNIQQEV